jgi:hypothetical protein
VLGAARPDGDVDFSAGRAVKRHAFAVLGTVALSLAVLGAQTRFTYSTGQSVSPAYEGWMPNADGSFTMYFGYMNTNWLEEFDIPTGPDNDIEPGGPDRGQPTHFYPRRNPFLFTINVPKDFGARELTWTITTHGKPERAYASLKTDYQIDNQVISTEIGGDFGSLRDELRTNIAPELRVEGEKRRTARVGERLTLIAFAGDPDNLPARRDGKPQPRHANGESSMDHPASSENRAGYANPTGSVNVANPRNASNQGGSGTPNPANLANLMYRPPSSIVPTSGPGLRFSWIVYRGRAASVIFTPDQMKTWIDTRAYANSPWSPPYAIPLPPPDGKWVTEVTFAEPGTYVLRGVACDGSVFTYDNVTVDVTR